MGAFSAVLAGACVAPILIAVLVLTADLFAKGHWIALGLPFVLGLGMALPWPFVGAGLQVLPKPGAWMRWVNKSFAVLVFAFAVWYGYLAVQGFAHGGDSPHTSAGDTSSGDSPRADLGGSPRVVAVTPAGFPAALKQAKRPVLVDCWSTWCKNCAAMDAVLAKPEVQQRLKDWTVIRLQAEDMRELLSLPGFEKIRGLPTLVVIP